MSWVENLRKQPHAKKIRLIWICCGIATVIMIAIWAITWHYRKSVTPDTSIIDTLGQGIHDMKNNYNNPLP